ncbi:hypothetical protein BDF19DRAFT_447183 [Syncephalis fuscata]|nr:hypothetical protein BDF19DRAFT_447183 [Syncephalis fuscata]
MVTAWTRDEPDAKEAPYYQLGLDNDELCIALIILSALIGSLHLWRYQRTKHIYYIVFTFGLVAYASHFGLALSGRSGVGVGVAATWFIMSATVQMLVRWAVTIDKQRRRIGQYLVWSLVVCQIVLTAFACIALAFWINRTFELILFQLGHYGLIASSGLLAVVAVWQLILSWQDNTNLRHARQRHAIILCVMASLQIAATISMVLFFPLLTYTAELLICIIATIV